MTGFTPTVDLLWLEQAVDEHPQVVEDDHEQVEQRK
jgi:hypothetical protein